MPALTLSISVSPLASFSGNRLRIWLSCNVELQHALRTRHTKLSDDTNDKSRGAFYLLNPIRPLMLPSVALLLQVRTKLCTSHAQSAIPVVS
jgi:hypothetical protein